MINKGAPVGGQPYGGIDCISLSIRRKSMLFLLETNYILFFFAVSIPASNSEDLNFTKDEFCTIPLKSESKHACYDNLVISVNKMGFPF